MVFHLLDGLVPHGLPPLGHQPPGPRRESLGLPPPLLLGHQPLLLPLEAGTALVFSMVACRPQSSSLSCPPSPYTECSFLKARLKRMTVFTPQILGAGRLRMD